MKSILFLEMKLLCEAEIYEERMELNTFSTNKQPSDTLRDKP